MKENFLINNIIKTVAAVTIAVIVVGQVEFTFVIEKKKINMLQSILDTGKVVKDGYTVARKVF